MRTIIPKIFSQTTKFGNLITFLFQGVYPQGKTGLISQHLCMRMSIIVFIGLLLYINFALNLNFLSFFSMIFTLISPFSFQNNVRHHTVKNLLPSVEWLLSCCLNILCCFVWCQSHVHGGLPLLSQLTSYRLFPD